MDSKFIPWSTIKDHYATLVDQNAPGRWYWPDYAMLLGLPAAVGIVVGYFFRFRDMASYIAGVSVFTALLFALVIYVFQLRMQLLDNPKIPRDGLLNSFIDQVFANVNYAVVAGIVATAVTMVAALTANSQGEINSVWSGVVSALGIHLMLVVFMCIKRLRAAYREIGRIPRSMHA